MRRAGKSGWDGNGTGKVEPPWPLVLSSSQGLLVQVGTRYPDQWPGQSQLPREMLNGPGDVLPVEPGSSNANLGRAAFSRNANRLVNSRIYRSVLAVEKIRGDFFSPGGNAPQAGTAFAAFGFGFRRNTFGGAIVAQVMHLIGQQQ